MARQLIHEDAAIQPGQLGALFGGQPTVAVERESEPQTSFVRREAGGGGGSVGQVHFHGGKMRPEWRDVKRLVGGTRYQQKGIGFE